MNGKTTKIDTQKQPTIAARRMDIRNWVNFYSNQQLIDQGAAPPYGSTERIHGTDDYEDPR